MLRDARLLRIFEGPSETLTMFLGTRVFSENAELYSYLANDLEAAHIAESLRSAVGQLSQRWNSNYARNSRQDRQWLQYRAGELAMWSVLQAALQASSHDCTETIGWANARFEPLFESAMNLSHIHI